MADTDTAAPKDSRDDQCGESCPATLCRGEHGPHRCSRSAGHDGRHLFHCGVWDDGEPFPPRVPVVAEDAAEDEARTQGASVPDALGSLGRWQVAKDIALNGFERFDGAEVDEAFAAADALERDVVALTEALRVARNERDEPLARVGGLEDAVENEYKARHLALAELAALRLVADRRGQALASIPVLLDVATAHAEMATGYEDPQHRANVAAVAVNALEEVRQIVRAALLVDGPAKPACPGCGGRGEVPATPGQPGDGPMPCPRCADVPAPDGTERNQA